MLSGKGAPSARVRELHDVVGRGPAFGHREHVRCPGVEGGALLGCPVVPLVDASNPAAAAADVVQHRFGDFESHAYSCSNFAGRDRMHDAAVLGRLARLGTLLKPAFAASYTLASPDRSKPRHHARP